MKLGVQVSLEHARWEARPVSDQRPKIQKDAQRSHIISRSHVKHAAYLEVYTIVTEAIAQLLPQTR